jgi:hypothetical protein
LRPPRLERIIVTADTEKMRTVAAQALAHVRRMDNMIGELLHTLAFRGGGTLQWHRNQADRQAAPPLSRTGHPARV